MISSLIQFSWWVFLNRNNGEKYWRREKFLLLRFIEKWKTNSIKLSEEKTRTWKFLFKKVQGRKSFPTIYYFFRFRSAYKSLDWFHLMEYFPQSHSNNTLKMIYNLIEIDTKKKTIFFEDLFLTKAANWIPTISEWFMGA